MKKFEYKYQAMSEIYPSTDVVIKWLDQHGQRGWEVVHLHVSETVSAYFKREMPVSKTEGES